MGVIGSERQFAFQPRAFCPAGVLGGEVIVVDAALGTRPFNPIRLFAWPVWLWSCLSSSMSPLPLPFHPMEVSQSMWFWASLLGNAFACFTCAADIESSQSNDGSEDPPFVQSILQPPSSKRRSSQSVRATLDFTPPFGQVCISRFPLQVLHKGISLAFPSQPIHPSARLLLSLLWRSHPNSLLLLLPFSGGQLLVDTVLTTQALL
ncbi:MAG: hypothetical protein FRX48_02276 [Lasallia pustulata]|uniref:Uncharacterized protein n=1 Tax=Lasallia pustulata TaxID=136370 RepID=A0A5M8PXU4_9LECA|nr:MAG: hypothetical protein FRX48_02276 [Lasallia pustulata]